MQHQKTNGCIRVTYVTTEIIYLMQRGSLNHQGKKHTTKHDQVTREKATDTQLKKCKPHYSYIQLCACKQSNIQWEPRLRERFPLTHFGWKYKSVHFLMENVIIYQFKIFQYLHYRGLALYIHCTGKYMDGIMCNNAIYNIKNL